MARYQEGSERESHRASSAEPPGIQEGIHFLGSLAASDGPDQTREAVSARVVQGAPRSDLRGVLYESASMEAGRLRASSHERTRSAYEAVCRSVTGQGRVPRARRLGETERLPVGTPGLGNPGSARAFQFQP